MNQIDTSIYNRIQRPGEALSRIAGGIDSYRQGNMQNLQMQQQQINLQNQQRKQEKAEDLKRRQDEYKNLMLANPTMSPEERTKYENQIFAPEILEQRLRGGGRTADPYAGRKMELKEQEAKQKAERLRISNERLGLTKDTNEQKKLRLQESIDAQDWREAVKVTDDIARGVAQEEIIANRQWTNQFKLNKGPREYAQAQGELLGQVPALVRANYRGSAAQSVHGKDLTPENIKVLTTATVGTSKILESTDALLSMVEKHGKEVMPSEEKAQMESLISDIALAYKGDDFARLGVLNGDDLKILVKIMGDPTSLTGMPANQQKKKLETFRGILLKGYNKKLDTRGFNPLSPSQLSTIGGTSTSPLNKDNKLISDSIADEYGIK